MILLFFKLLKILKVELNFSNLFSLLIYFEKHLLQIQF